MSDIISFDKAEKFSYAYVDGKYAKISTVAAGSGQLVDPLAWSYAETHSYVKIDPATAGIAVPSGFDKDVFAKVIFVSNTNNFTASSRCYWNCFRYER